MKDENTIRRLSHPSPDPGLTESPDLNESGRCAKHKDRRRTPTMGQTRMAMTSRVATVRQRVLAILALGSDLFLMRCTCGCRNAARSGTEHAGLSLQPTAPGARLRLPRPADVAGGTECHTRGHGGSLDGHAQMWVWPFKARQRTSLQARAALTEKVGRQLGHPQPAVPVPLHESLPRGLERLSLIWHIRPTAKAVAAVITAETGCAWPVDRAPSPRGQFD